MPLQYNLLVWRRAAIL